MSGIIRAAALLCAVAGAAEFCGAGVVIKGQNQDMRDKKTVDVTMLVDASRLRTNMKGENVDASMIFLLQGDDYKMLVIDNSKKEYRVLDRKTIEQIEVQVTGAMAQMQEQMKKMPPEQGAMMEKMMGKMGAMRGEKAKPVQIAYKKIGSGMVNGRACTKYEGMLEAEKLAEICAAPPQSLDLTPEDFAVVEKMTAVFEDMAKMMGQHLFTPNQSMKLSDKQIDGMPIEFIQFQSGQPASKFELKDSSRQNFSDADFSPGDAKEVKMPLGSDNN